MPSQGSGQVRLSLVDASDGRTFDVSPARLVVAGYTGRDEAKVREHIAELAAIGVPPPASVPTFFHLDPALLTTEPQVQVPSGQTSGEVEPVLVRHEGRFYLGVGSDHTDRELERSSVHDSKARCVKPVGRNVVPLAGEPGAGSSDWDWDGVHARCSVDGSAYQAGRLDQLRRPADILGRLRDSGVDADGDLVLFCGTLPLLAGEFVYGRDWRLELELAGRWTLTHAYRSAPTP